MLVVLLAHAPALAWSLVPDRPVSLPDPALDVGVANRYGRGAVVIVDGTTLTAYDDDGAPRGTVPTDATALLLRRQDADGYEDAVLCGPSGLAVALYTLEFSAPAPFASTPCYAIAAHTYDGGGVAAVGSASIDIWRDALPNTFTGPEAIDANIGDAPVIAATGDRIGAVDVGDDVFYEVSTWGLSALAAGGTVGGLVVRDGDFVVSLPDRLAIRSMGAGLDPVPGAAFALATGDLDADGLSDLVAVLDDGRLLVRTSADGAERIVDPGMFATDVAIGNLDTDGCDDIVVTSATTPAWVAVRVTDCAIAADADHDGFPLDLGDCDDADPLVYPGAVERCNAIDDDCDGATDELTGIQLHAPQDLNEGDELVAYATVDGCDPGYTWAWQLPNFGDAATCTVVGPEVHCDLLDDASGVLQVDAIDPSSVADTDTADTDVAAATWTVAQPLVVHNVAPTLLPPLDGNADDLSDGYIVLEPDQQVTGSFRYFDPGADTITFGSQGGALDVAPSGAFTLEAPSPGSLTSVTVWVADDDGGEDFHTVEIEVLPADTGSEDPWSDEDYACGGLACEPIDPCGGMACFLSGFGFIPLLRRRVR